MWVYFYLTFCSNHCISSVYCTIHYTILYIYVGGRGTSGTAAPPLKQPCTAGLHLRVHFDGFKATWDEWYDQRDFDAGMG